MKETALDTQAQVAFGMVMSKRFGAVDLKLVSCSPWLIPRVAPADSAAPYFCEQITLDEKLLIVIEEGRYIFHFGLSDISNLIVFMFHAVPPDAPLGDIPLKPI